MSFSERRYESHGAGAPIFGIRPTLRVKPNAWLPTIPNIGSRCSYRVNHRHIAFQKKTCPPVSLCNTVNYFGDTMLEIMGDPAMKILKSLGILAAVLLLAISCAADSEKLKEESKKAYPNQEWKRPPRHWSPR
jgi:hypothetical protein